MFNTQKLKIKNEIRDSIWFLTKSETKPVEMNKSLQHIFIELLKSSKIKGLFDRNIFGPLVKRSKSQFVLRLERRKCRETSLQSLKNSSFVYHVIQYQTMAECCYHHMLHSGLMQHFFLLRLLLLSVVEKGPNLMIWSFSRSSS